MTLIESLMVLAISGLILAGAGRGLGLFGRKETVEFEASRLIDNLWHLRSRATVGIKNPCMDFPDGKTVRLYSDVADIPDGFGPRDGLLLS